MGIAVTFAGVVNVGKMVEMQYGIKRMCDKYAQELEFSSRG